MAKWYSTVQCHLDYLFWFFCLKKWNNAQNIIIFWHFSVKHSMDVQQISKQKYKLYAWVNSTVSIVHEKIE